HWLRSSARPGRRARRTLARPALPRRTRRRREPPDTPAPRDSQSRELATRCPARCAAGWHRLDHAGVDGERLAANQPLGHAALDGRLEYLAQQIALAEAAMPVL